MLAISELFLGLCACVAGIGRLDLTAPGAPLQHDLRTSVLAAISEGHPVSSPSLLTTSLGLCVDVLVPVFPLGANASTLSPAQRFGVVLGVARLTINLPRLVQRTMKLLSVRAGDVACLGPCWCFRPRGVDARMRRATEL